MIRYALVCAAGHAAEGWFRSSADFDRESTAGRLACAACGSADIRKAVMAPALGAASRGAASADGDAGEAPATVSGSGSGGGSGGAEAGSAGPQKPAPPEPVAPASPDPRHAALREMLREMRKHVAANSDYVGPRFAEEARKIHYKETQARGIHGEASPEEAKALSDDGIEFHPLPPFPEDRN